MKIYADTNFFSRLYLNRPDLPRIKALLAEAEADEEVPLPVTWLHRVETLNAFELYVFTGKFKGHPRITSEQAAAARAAFQEDIAGGSLLAPAQIEPRQLEWQVEEIALRHTAKHGFRTYDLLHVASALLLGCETFWSFDSKASKLAELEGLDVL